MLLVITVIWFKINFIRSPANSFSAEKIQYKTWDDHVLINHSKFVRRLTNSSNTGWIWQTSAKFVTRVTNSADVCGIFNSTVANATSTEQPTRREGVSPFDVEQYFLPQKKRPVLKSLSAFCSISLTRGYLWKTTAWTARRLDLARSLTMLCSRIPGFSLELPQHEDSHAFFACLS